MFTVTEQPEECFRCGEKIAVGDDAVEDAAGELVCIAGGCGIDLLSDEECAEIMLEVGR
jgi:hypothetical protein